MTGGDTAGSIGVLETSSAPGFGPPDHDDERVQAIAARYDSVFVGPPL
jgi:hypothetical protein